MTWSWASLKTAKASAPGLPRLAQPQRQRLEQVPLAVLEQVELPAAVGRALLAVAARRGGDEALDEAAGGGALDDGPGELAGAEPHHAEGVEVAERVAVVGEQALGDELEQHRVVALERREHVGVGLEGREPVDGEVARAAARLAAGLDGGRRVGRRRPP